MIGDKITCVSINNPMCEVTYKFPFSKFDFLVNFQNQLAGCGYFMETTMSGETIVLNPANCSFIEITEKDFKG